MRQDWRGFEPKKRSMAGMQALSPSHSPYSVTNARNQIRNKSALESRGSGAAPPTLQFLEWPPTSVLDHMLILAHLPILALLSSSGSLPVQLYFLIEQRRDSLSRDLTQKLDADSNESSVENTIHDDPSHNESTDVYDPSLSSAQIPRRDRNNGF